MMSEEKFETAIERLEQIVTDLEKGNVELDQALKLFEEGIGLIKTCDRQLKDAEQRLETLIPDSGGE